MDPRVQLQQMVDALSEARFALHPTLAAEAQKQIEEFAAKHGLEVPNPSGGVLGDVPLIGQPLQAAASAVVNGTIFRGRLEGGYRDAPPAESTPLIDATATPEAMAGPAATATPSPSPTPVASAPAAMPEAPAPAATPAVERTRRRSVWNLPAPYEGPVDMGPDPGSFAPHVGRIEESRGMGASRPGQVTSGVDNLRGVPLNLQSGDIPPFQAPPGTYLTTEDPNTGNVTVKVDMGDGRFEQSTYEWSPGQVEPGYSSIQEDGSTVNYPARYVPGTAGWRKVAGSTWQGVMEPGEAERPYSEVAAENELRGSNIIPVYTGGHEADYSSGRDYPERGERRTGEIDVTDTEAFPFGSSAEQVGGGYIVRSPDRADVAYSTADIYYMDGTTALEDGFQPDGAIDWDLTGGARNAIGGGGGGVGSGPSAFEIASAAYPLGEMSPMQFGGEVIPDMFVFNDGRALQIYSSPSAVGLEPQQIATITGGNLSEVGDVVASILNGAKDKQYSVESAQTAIDGVWEIYDKAELAREQQRIRDFNAQENEFDRVLQRDLQDRRDIIAREGYAAQLTATAAQYRTDNIGYAIAPGQTYTRGKQPGGPFATVSEYTGSAYTAQPAERIPIDFQQVYSEAKEAAFSGADEPETVATTETA